MGNNAAFTAFEATVIAAYNKGILDRELLSSFMEVYRNMDIDSGGMRGTLSKDGLDCEDIILKVFNYTVAPKPEIPADYRTWTDKQRDLNDEWQELRSEQLREITDQFGWC